MSTPDNLRQFDKRQQLSLNYLNKN